MHPQSLLLVEPPAGGRGNWSVQTVLNGTDVVSQPTSAAFGRGEGWEDTLFVTTDVSLASGGTVGGVVAVDVTGV